MPVADDHDPWTGKSRKAATLSGGAAGKGKDAKALQVVQIADVEPLGDQRGIHGKVNVPEALMEVLFAQPEPTRAEIAAAGGDAAAVPPLGTFAILDGAKIRGLGETLAGYGLEHRCLYQGEAYENLRDSAPWIVRLTTDCTFTRNLFTQGTARWHLWDKGAGIFLRARGTVDGLARHFRKFTYPRTEDGGSLFFRFYDPTAAQVYFEGIADWPERAAQFFQPRSENAVLAIIACPPGGTTASVFMPVDPAMQGSAPVFRMLTSRDTQIIADATMKKFRSELKAWLLRYDKGRFGAFEPAQLDAIVEHAIAEGDGFGLTFKEEYTYLLYIMTYFGGWFHKTNRYPALVEIFGNGGDARMPALTKAFPAEFARQFGDGVSVFSLWKRLMAELEADLAAGGGWPALTKAKTGAVIDRASRHLEGEDRTRLGAYLKQTAADHLAAGIVTEPMQCVAQLLSFVMGYRFTSDPLFPWTAAMMKAGPTPDAAMAEIGNYALRRAKRIKVAGDGGG
ncbi:MAG: DUF4123 domain-containing protein [Rhodobacteraceae bacterium]|nr:DUF4123 domain-containing protein [Paracoccaceae bacterium]